MLTRSLALGLMLMSGAVTFAAGAGAQDFGGFRRGGGEPGAFDFYVLALSWSPTYCDGEGARRDRDGQCAPGRGLGFVVHGLWPQYDRGFPSNCSAVERPLTRNAIEAAGEVMPSEGLARHEWRTHGTCSGLDPVAYFKAVKTARTAVTIPDAFTKPDGTIRAAPIDIARQFVAANKGLRPDMMSVTCRRGQLQEVRICFSKDLRGFSPCPEVARQNCRAGEVTIEAAR